MWPLFDISKFYLFPIGSIYIPDLIWPRLGQVFILERTAKRLQSWRSTTRSIFSLSLDGAILLSWVLMIIVFEKRVMINNHSVILSHKNSYFMNNDFRENSWKPKTRHLAPQKREYSSRYKSMTTSSWPSTYFHPIQRQTLGWRALLLQRSSASRVD